MEDTTGLGDDSASTGSRIAAAQEFNYMPARDPDFPTRDVQVNDLGGKSPSWEAIRSSKAWMQEINLSAVSCAQEQSSKGRFRRVRQDITSAMRATNGEKARTLSWPFEVDLVRVPPRAVNWPYHAHSVQWEFYIVFAGRGQVRTLAGVGDVREGDWLAHSPGQPHQLTNTGATDLVYYLIADNPPSDACHYPDTNKWALPERRKPVRVTPVDYYDGEE